MSNTSTPALPAISDLPVISDILDIVPEAVAAPVAALTLVAVVLAMFWRPKRRIRDRGPISDTPHGRKAHRRQLAQERAVADIATAIAGVVVFGIVVITGFKHLA